MKQWKFWYIVLVCIRFICVFLPQTGYIHPDEFFQSSEVVYGDNLDVQHLRTWEFDSEKPIRSITVPYLLHSIPLLFLKLTNLQKTKYYSYILLIFPRFIMCLLSFVHDLCIMKISSTVRCSFKKPLLAFSSSYVLLVYFLRTFSNAIESVCFTIVVYLVLRSYRSNATKSANTFVPFLIGVLITMGMFVRPTFLLFSFVPVVYWLFFLTKSWYELIKNSVGLVVGSLSAFIPLAVIDTVYYGGNDINALDTNFFLELHKKRLILTPWNFVLYNLNHSNLASHGLHPFYLHFSINVPVMFSVVGVGTLVYFCQILYHFSKHRRLLCSHIELFMVSSFVVPIFLLSIFPHQEPRFLAPLILPAVFVFSDFVMSVELRHNVLAVLWIMTNVFCVVIFGFLHQGGLIPSLAYFQHKIANSPIENAFNLVFYHTYIPPQYLLAVPRSGRRVKIHDLAGMDSDSLLGTLKFVTRNPDDVTKNYVVLPNTLTISVVHANIVLGPHYRLTLEETFFPHLTTEDFPPVHNIINVLKSSFSMLEKFVKIGDFFKLCIYRIEPVS